MSLNNVIVKQSAFISSAHYNTIQYNTITIQLYFTGYASHTQQKLVSKKYVYISYALK